MYAAAQPQRWACVVVVLWALLLVAPAAAVNSSATPPPDDLTTISLDDDFNKICELVGPFIPLPKVLPQELCESTGFTNKTSMCSLVGLIEKGLLELKSESKGGSSCSSSLQTPSATTSLSGASLPFPFSNQRPLPSALPASLLASEGASYYWLYKNLLNFELWAGCAATNTSQRVTLGTPKTGNAATDWMVPAGWTVYSTLWQADGSSVLSSGLYWPFSTVIYKGDSVVVFIRGTETAKDWQTDFNYRQIPGEHVTGMALPGMVHQGFATVAASLWPGIKSALQELVRHRSSGTAIKHVYVAGHSLGAAVSTLIAYRAQGYLRVVDNDLRVNALLIAPPNVGDATFAAHFGRRVNARRIPFLYDLVPQIPCSPTMIACNGTRTANPKLWSYTEVPGTLLLQPDQMPQQSEAWSLLDKIYPCQIGRFLRATHICSYQCYMSQFVSDSNNLCQLWNEPTSNPPTGSYCFKFPVPSGPQYPYKPL